MTPSEFREDVWYSWMVELLRGEETMTIR